MTTTMRAPGACISENEELRSPVRAPLVSWILYIYMRPTLEHKLHRPQTILASIDNIMHSIGDMPEKSKSCCRRHKSIIIPTRCVQARPQIRAPIAKTGRQTHCDARHRHRRRRQH